MQHVAPNWAPSSWMQMTKNGHHLWNGMAQRRTLKLPQLHLDFTWFSNQITYVFFPKGVLHSLYVMTMISRYTRTLLCLTYVQPKPSNLPEPALAAHIIMFCFYFSPPLGSFISSPKVEQLFWTDAGVNPESSIRFLNLLPPLISTHDWLQAPCLKHLLK